MKLKSEQGLTLIEVLASVVIISIVFVTFFYFFVQGHLHTRINGEKLAAIELAQKGMSKVLQYDINDESTRGQCDPHSAGSSIIACYDFMDSLNSRDYHTYVLVQKQESVDNLGLYLVIARTYYNGKSFVELDNYTPKGE